MRLVLVLLLSSLASAQGMGGKSGIGGKAGFGGGASAGGGGTWTLVQTGYFDTVSAGSGTTCTANTSACTLTLASAVTAGNAVICYVYTANSNTLSSCSGETTTSCAACTIFDSGTGGINIRYVTLTAGGETNVTCNIGTTSVFIGCGAAEFHWSGSSISFDLGGSTDDTSACISCAGQSLTLTGTDAVIQLALPAASGFSAISTPYTFHNYGGNGLGDGTAINLTGTTSPTWTQTASAIATVSGMALKGN